MKIALACSHVITKNVAYNTASILRTMEQCRGESRLDCIRRIHASGV